MRDLSWSDVTPETVYLRRRQLLAGAAAMSVAPLAAALAPLEFRADRTPPVDEVTPEPIASSYNNFYEFGTDKAAPKKHAAQLTTDPWSVEVSGEVAKPGRYDLADILKPHVLEERIYRLRCVEAWSMVIPWIGFPLGDLLRRFEPTADARYVAFTTLYRPSEMPGQRSLWSGIEFPYVEGLRLDEAYHPLALIAVGMYGKVLPNQNGAPLRLVVPWKYGFKSIKSIVKVRLTKRQPRTTWNESAPREYGFYANVNPDVDHPRWSQKSERRLPSSLFDQNRIPTLPFNGYGDEVARLYAGMDLRKYY